MLIREMKLGDSASVTKTVTETDVYLFAGITGDLNPAHTNEVSASQTQFGGRIAHGILGAGFISAVLGMKLPGISFSSSRARSKAPCMPRPPGVSTISAP